MTNPGDRQDMRPFAKLASFESARRAAAELALPVAETEKVALQLAVDRVVAESAAARIDVPSADRSAMDGFALRAADAEVGACLRRTGRIAAGEPPSGRVEAGTCIEVATGAPLPAGADAVAPVEATRRDGGDIHLTSSFSEGQHVSRRGEDLLRGKPVARPGEMVSAALLAACAAGGIAELVVWRRPRILIAPTGDEVMPLDAELEPGQVYDSNALGLIALMTQAGAEAVHAGIVVDEAAALEEVLSRPGFDLVATIGGTSVGRRDLVSDTLRREGEILVHGVDVRPGKPLLLGRVRGRAVVGLPGFPTTCMMLGYAVLDPMARRMGHRSLRRACRRVNLAEAVRSPAGKAHLLPVLVDGDSARPTFTFSSSVSSMAHASGWIEIPADITELAAGTDVTVHLF